MNTLTGQTDFRKEHRGIAVNIAKPAEAVITARGSQGSRTATAKPLRACVTEAYMAAVTES